MAEKGTRKLEEMAKTPGSHCVHSAAGPSTVSQAGQMDAGPVAAEGSVCHFWHPGFLSIGGDFLRYKCLRSPVHFDSSPSRLA